MNTPLQTFAKPDGDKLRLHGHLTSILRHADGTEETFEADNIIVDVGFDFISDALFKPSARPVVMSHIAIGTSSTAAAAGDTTLVAEVAREALSYAHTAGTKIIQVEATFAAGTGTGTITEAGVFNDATTGTMLDRVVFTGIPKGASDVLIQRFTFTMS